MISALLLSSSYFKLNITEYEIHSRLNAKMESGIHYVLSDNGSRPESFQLLQLGENGDSVSIKTKVWGFFRTALVEAYHKSFKKRKVFLYGSTLDTNMNSCIYLADHDRPLSLVGDTKLTGDIFLPKAGIKAGYINQRGFDYPQLVTGRQKLSKGELPTFNQDLKNYVLNLFDTALITNSNESFTNTISQSFAEHPFILQSSEPVILKESKLEGHVIVRSDSSITVAATANLINVILVAPTIRIEKGFRGIVQAFATDSLFVESNCYFDYPSVLCVIKKKPESLPPFIKCDKNCSLTGLIVALSSDNDRFKPMVQLEAANVYGIIYCQGFLTINGNIRGSILTDYFLYRSSSTVFENYLMDVEVNRNKLSPFFVGGIFSNNARENKIIQWLQ
jgi:hypothetical protein